MKIVNLLGGLGNQMFEYAMYLALKHAHPEEEIKVTTRSLRGYPLHNGLEIQKIFGVELQEATLWDLTRIAYPFFNYNTWRVMRHCLPVRRSMTRGGFDIPFDYSQVSREDSAYYEGYWQNEKNFLPIRKEILKAYTFPTFTDQKSIDLADKISKCNSVSLHVRRGDYVNHPFLCECTAEYYKHAIEKMNLLENPDMYCIFSDDIDWCKTELSELLIGKTAVFVDWNMRDQNYRDMQLMSLCSHNIIANSSFSWWGAWLNQNPNKTVISPVRFANCEIKNDPICDNWIRVD